MFSFGAPAFVPTTGTPEPTFGAPAADTATPTVGAPAAFTFGATPTHTTLMEASRDGHTVTAQALLGAGADVNAADNVRAPQRRSAPAAERRRSLTRRVRRAAAPPGRLAAPPS